MIVGEHSEQFWSAAAGEVAAISAAVLADLGHDPTTAPGVVVAVVRTLAQATLLRDAAFMKMAEQGGAFSERTAKPRASLRVWSEASDRVLAAARQLGLHRVPRPAPTLAEVLAATPVEGHRVD